MSSPASLLKVVLRTDLQAEHRRRAFAELMKPSALSPESAEAIFALAALWSQTLDPESSQAVQDLGLNLYNEARQLPITALMQRCGCAESVQTEAMTNAGLNTVAELVRYCGDDDSYDGGDDVEEACSGLMMETAGALKRAALEALVFEARAICDATAALHGVTAESGNAHGLASEDLHVDEVGDDDLDGVDEDDGPLPGTRSIGC